MSSKIGTVLIDIKADTAKLVSGMNNAQRVVKKSVDSIKRDILAMASAYLGFQAASRAMDAVIKTGFEYNKQLEESKAGLVALSVAIKDSNVPIMQRYAEANKEATHTLQELQKINAQTPHTLNQTNQIYKAMYVSMKNAGASTSDLITLTKKISIAAGAGGIEFNSLLAGVDGLATGTVLANSDLGRFLSSLGLTNKALKESKDVTKLLEDKLSSFKAPDTMQVALSNVSTAWDTLTGKITKDSFNGAKVGIKEFATLLNSLSDEDIQGLTNATNSFGVVVLNVMYGASSVVVELTNAFDSLGARIAGVAYRLSNGIMLDKYESAALEQMYENTKKDIVAREKFLEVLHSSSEAAKKALMLSQASTEEAVKTTEEVVKTKIALEEVLFSKADLQELDQLGFKIFQDNEKLKLTALDDEAKARDKISLKLEREAELQRKSLALAQANARAVEDAVLRATGTDEEIFYHNLGEKTNDLFEKGATEQQLTKFFFGEESKYKTKLAEDANKIAKKQAKDISKIASNNTLYRATGNSTTIVGDSTNIRKVGRGFVEGSLEEQLSQIETFLKGAPKKAHLNAASEASQALSVYGHVVKSGLSEYGKASLEAFNIRMEIEARDRAKKAEEERLRLEKEYNEATKTLINSLSELDNAFASLSDSLGKDYLKSARETLFGGTNDALSFHEAYQTALDAWGSFQDTNNQELLDTYHSSMDALVGTLNQFNDSSKYATSQEQEFSKYLALRQIEGFQDAQLDTQEEVDLQLEVLQQMQTILADGQVTREEALTIADSSNRILTDGTLETNDTQAIDWLTAVHNATQDGVVSTDELKTLTGITNSKIEAQTPDIAKTEENTAHTGRYKVTNELGQYSVPNENGLGSTLYTGVLSSTYTPYKQGGYTGNYGVDDIAGVVHGQEYVINAQTTSDLGLNGSGGVFHGILSELKSLRAVTIAQANELRTLRKEAQDQTQILQDIEAVA